MLETLIDKPAVWLSGNGPENDVAVISRGVLYRNLADFPFPGRCSDEEKRTVEARVLSVLESANLLAQGRYCSFQNMSPREARFLGERQLVGDDLIRGKGARGVYISDDQSVSISVNEEDHLTFRVLASGLQLTDIWTRLNLLDDLLAVSLDYSFDVRRGYLASALCNAGTGLRLTVALHAPALTAANKMLVLEQSVRENHHLLDGVFGHIGEDKSDLYQLTNLATLGRSEEEIVFHLRQTALDIIAQERKARESLMSEGARALDDRVGRALGMARSARLLEFGEALSVLSSIRLGVAAGLIDGYSYRTIHEMLIAARKAHVETRKGHACDEVMLSMERADLFRARFA